MVFFPVGRWRTIEYFFESTDERLRVFISDHVGDLGDRYVGVPQHDGRMVHADLSHKGYKIHTGFTLNQFGTVRDRVMEVFCDFFQSD